MKFKRTLIFLMAVIYCGTMQNCFSIDKKSIEISVNEAEMITFSEPVAELFIANPAVADVQLSSSKLAYVFGIAPGKTNVFATNEKGQQLLALSVNVAQNMEQAQELLEAMAPDADIKVRGTPAGMIIEGNVDDPKMSEDIRAVAQSFLGANQIVINRLNVRAPLQVNLRVKVAEVARTVINRLNFNWLSSFQQGDFSMGLLSGRSLLGTTSNINPATGETGPRSDLFASNFTDSNWNVTSVMDMLSREGLLTVLAEPNLIAISGETASFLAGGEFPYPVPQSSGGSNNITIEFKQFGVSLAFTPTVINGNMINMRVRPEVSELDFANQVQISGFTLPSVTTRRAETSVELASGQTFAIAGLLKNTVSSSIRGLPGMEDIPILGALFRSNAFERGDTELVFIVTPYIVQPVSGKEMALPTDGLEYATFVEQILERKLTKPGVNRGSAPAVGASGLRLIGPAGFSIE